jgi:hypothetical protein
MQPKIRWSIAGFTANHEARSASCHLSWKNKNYNNHTYIIIPSDPSTAGMKLARSPDSSALTGGNAMGNRKFGDFDHEKLRRSASGSHNQDSPTTDWARTVAIIAANDNAAVNTARKRLSRADIHVLTKTKQ